MLQFCAVDVLRVAGAVFVSHYSGVFLFSPPGVTDRTRFETLSRECQILKIYEFTNLIQGC